MNKLTLVEKEELMGSWEALDCNDIGGARPIDTHGWGNLVPAGDIGELVSGPYSKNGSHSEIGVHNAGPIEGVKGNAEATYANQWQCDRLRYWILNSLTYFTFKLDTTQGSYC